MCSIEGCQAFKDLCDNTEFLRWYEPMKEAVTQHKGGSCIPLPPLQQVTSN